jgi:hypothetical protein
MAHEGLAASSRPTPPCCARPHHDRLTPQCSIAHSTVSSQADVGHARGVSQGDVAPGQVALLASAKWCAVLLICRFDVELLGKR